MKSIARTLYPHSFIYAIASFGMTFLRLGVAFYAGVSILTDHYYSKEITIISILFIMIFDYYDGALFEKSFLRSVKEWRINRRVLDSLVDRTVIQIICLPLLLNHKSFLWIYVAILVREIILSGYLARLFKRNILLYPELIAKLACAMIGVTTIAYLTTTFYVSLFVTGFMLIMSCLALKEYRDRLKRHLQIENVNQPRDNIVEVF